MVVFFFFFYSTVFKDSRIKFNYFGNKVASCKQVENVVVEIHKSVHKCVQL